MLQVHKILNPKLMKKVCVKVLGLSEGIEASQNRKAKSPDIAVRAIAYRVAVRTGLEPATPGVTGRYSNRLNYRTALCSPSGTRRILRGVALAVNAFSYAGVRLPVFSSYCVFLQRNDVFMPAKGSCRPFSSPGRDAVHAPSPLRRWPPPRAARRCARRAGSLRRFRSAVVHRP